MWPLYTHTHSTRKRSAHQATWPMKRERFYVLLAPADRVATVDAPTAVNRPRERASSRD